MYLLLALSAPCTTDLLSSLLFDRPVLVEDGVYRHQLNMTPAAAWRCCSSVGQEIWSSYFGRLIAFINATSRLF